MDDNGGDGDGRHEDARAPILAGVDTSPVLKPSEHILDLVTAAVEQDVMRDQHFQVGECGTEPVGVATPVSGQRFGLWKGIDHERRTLMIAHFPSLSSQPWPSQTACSFEFRPSWSVGYIGEQRHLGRLGVMRS